MEDDGASYTDEKALFILESTEGVTEVATEKLSNKDLWCRSCSFSTSIAAFCGVCSDVGETRFRNSDTGDIGCLFGDSLFLGGTWFLGENWLLNSDTGDRGFPFWGLGGAFSLLAVDSDSVHGGSLNENSLSVSPLGDKRSIMTGSQASSSFEGAFDSSVSRRSLS
jgi:hypothetical protein